MDSSMLDTALFLILHGDISTDVVSGQSVFQQVAGRGKLQTVYKKERPKYTLPNTQMLMIDIKSRGDRSKTVYRFLIDYTGSTTIPEGPLRYCSTEALFAPYAPRKVYGDTFKASPAKLGDPLQFLTMQMTNLAESAPEIWASFIDTLKNGSDSSSPDKDNGYWILRKSRRYAVPNTASSGSSKSAPLYQVVATSSPNWPFLPVVTPWSGTGIELFSLLPHELSVLGIFTMFALQRNVRIPLLQLGDTGAQPNESGRKFIAGREKIKNSYTTIYDREPGKTAAERVTSATTALQTKAEAIRAILWADVPPGEKPRSITVIGLIKLDLPSGETA